MTALVNSPAQCLDISVPPQKPNRRGPSSRDRLPLKNLTDAYHQNGSLVTNFPNQYGVSVTSQLCPCRKTTGEAKSQLKGSLVRRRWEEERVCQINWLLNASVWDSPRHPYTVHMVLLLWPRLLNCVAATFLKAGQHLPLKLGSVTFCFHVWPTSLAGLTHNLQGSVQNENIRPFSKVKIFKRARAEH